MAKHRKTRKDKQLADSRHNFTHNFVSAAPYELKLDGQKTSKIGAETKQKTQAVSGGSYSYLVKDLSKTAMLTAAILAFQIILFFLFQHHALVISGLNY